MTAAANGANTCMKPWMFGLQRLIGGICFEPLIRKRRALKHPWLDLTLYRSGIKDTFVIKPPLCPGQIYHFSKRMNDERFCSTDGGRRCAWSYHLVELL